jgi:hypothetical protein
LNANAKVNVVITITAIAVNFESLKSLEASFNLGSIEVEAFLEIKASCCLIAFGFKQSLPLNYHFKRSLRLSLMSLEWPAATIESLSHYYYCYRQAIDLY